MHGSNLLSTIPSTIYPASEINKALDIMCSCLEPESPDPGGQEATNKLLVTACSSGRVDRCVPIGLFFMKRLWPEPSKH